MPATKRVPSSKQQAMPSKGPVQETNAKPLKPPKPGAQPKS